MFCHVIYYMYFCSENHKMEVNYVKSKGLHSKTLRFQSSFWK